MTARRPRTSKTSKTSKRNRSEVQVGDRVSFYIGQLKVLATVVHDYGNIGAGGRRLLSITTEIVAGEPERFDVPAEEVTLVRRFRAKT